MSTQGQRLTNRVLRHLPRPDAVAPPEAAAPGESDATEPPHTWRLGKVTGSIPLNDPDLPVMGVHWVELDRQTLEEFKGSATMDADEATTYAEAAPYDRGEDTTLGQGLPPGTLIEVCEIDGKWRFIHPRPRTMPGVLFYVMLEKVSGSQGGPSHTPSWKYKVTDLAGNVLSDEIMPEIRRLDAGEADPATDGVGYFCMNGYFHFVEAFEVALTLTCEDE